MNIFKKTSNYFISVEIRTPFTLRASFKYLSPFSLVQPGMIDERGGELGDGVRLGEPGLAVRLLAHPTQVVLAVLQ